MSYRARDPFLAELELHKLLFLFNQQLPQDSCIQPEAVFTRTLTKVLINYFSHFGTKPCFYKDISQYLSSLSSASTTSALIYSDEAKEFIKQLEEAFKNISSGPVNLLSISFGSIK